VALGYLGIHSDALYIFKIRRKKFTPAGPFPKESCGKLDCWRLFLKESYGKLGASILEAALHFLAAQGC
jgi:hypothetical protein